MSNLHPLFAGICRAHRMMPEPEPETPQVCERCGAYIGREAYMEAGEFLCRTCSSADAVKVRL